MMIVTADELLRLMNCNGSRLMSAASPKIDINKDARDEGDAAHWLAGELCKGVDGITKAPNGFMITAEMNEHVREYLGALDIGEMEVNTSFAGDGWAVNARCDHRVMRYEGEPGALPNHGNILTIDEFKYGRGLIEPFENWTLLAHAIGSCIQNRWTPDYVDLRIHQPRPYHPLGKVREWRITYTELMTYYERIAATLVNPSDMLNTGPWCRKCKVNDNCPAYRMATMNAIDASCVAFDDELPNDVLSAELDMLRNAAATIAGRLTAIEELAAYRLRQGHVVPNYATEAQYAHTRWKTGITGAALTVMTGIDCNKPGMITPAEFKRRGGSEGVYKALTDRPLTGTKLIRITADDRARRALGK